MFRHSAPVAAQPSRAQISTAPVSDSTSMSTKRRSISRASMTAASPPRTLFEALRRPKLFDTTSDEYSHELAASQPPKPLFPTPDVPVVSEQQKSLKRHHESGTGTSNQHKRRSSLKGRSSITSSDGSFKRSVHFADKHETRRSLPKEPQISSVSKESQVPSKKRTLDEQTDVQPDEQGPSAKLSKFSTTDEHGPFKFSVYEAENRPMPKLPILEKLEEKLARAKALCEPRPLTPDEQQYIEEARLKRARQVDEDEIALSRARILAEKLRNGPGIFDGWTGPLRQPWPDPKPITRILEKYKSQAHPPPARYPVHPPLTLHRGTRGYEVAYAPDTPDRPMTRTEQRIRRTGARGLAHLPLNFERHRREKAEKAKAEKAKADKENKEAGKKPEEVQNGSSRSA